MKKYTLAENISSDVIFSFVAYLVIEVGSLLAIVISLFYFSKTSGVKEILGAIGFAVLLIYMLASSIRGFFDWKTIELDDACITIKWHWRKKKVVFKFDMISEIRFVIKNVFETDWGERTYYSILIIGKKTEVLFERNISSVPDIPVIDDLPIKIAYHVTED